MKNTNIQWADHTFNPWEGCTKVSAGCAHCYAEARNQRFAGGVNWGPGAPRRRTSIANWTEPYKWDRDAGQMLALCRDLETPRPRVFCASLADVFDDEVPLEWFGDLLDTIRLCCHLDWLLLTKRPQNIEKRLLEVMAPPVTTEYEWKRTAARREWIENWISRSVPPPNVWLGTSVENQAVADERIQTLVNIPATVHFLSCEPLLGPVVIGQNIAFIDWVICGGESGAGARPMDEAWARTLREECDESPAAFFMKQMGGASDKRGELSDMPADLQVRQFP